MNATELYHQDGRPSGVWFCGECRGVSAAKEQADKCCEIPRCPDCGKAVDRKYWLRCTDCERVNEAKKEAARFEKAEQRTEWDGWVYREGTGREGFHESISDFLEDWECRDDATKPAYVWACKKVHFAAANISDITERIADNAYEDFSTDDLHGLDDLEAAIARFNEANKDVVSYEPDYGIAILLKGNHE